MKTRSFLIGPDDHARLVLTLEAKPLAISEPSFTLVGQLRPRRSTGDTLKPREDGGRRTRSRRVRLGVRGASDQADARAAQRTDPLRGFRKPVSWIQNNWSGPSLGKRTNPHLRKYAGYPEGGAMGQGGVIEANVSIWQRRQAEAHFVSDNAKSRQVGDDASKPDKPIGRENEARVKGGGASSTSHCRLQP
ncbi:hypothetical protein EYF80_060125 [Liparis tanakae]|uniref:Uncharacterized protein n=1 Tax=Liparis tanakae TaxID=230148 RepID=A0A4Z2ELF3_9TELE|nr:hypothetical protein EYF80_060125 [Liparis tanakae]